MKGWFSQASLNFGELINLGGRNSEIFSTSDVSTKKQVNPVFFQVLLLLLTCYK